MARGFKILSRPEGFLSPWSVGFLSPFPHAGVGAGLVQRVWNPPDIRPGETAVEDRTGRHQGRPATIHGALTRDDIGVSASTEYPGSLPLGSPLTCSDQGGASNFV